MKDGSWSGIMENAGQLRFEERPGEWKAEALARKIEHKSSGRQ
jgi:hypothetical protein